MTDKMKNILKRQKERDKEIKTLLPEIDPHLAILEGKKLKDHLQ